ncbi:Bax inhibitor 1 [Apostasia shenzhenica]|uniref:Bax inhibitor 1 n=1 Tax=Apostasia shenzhenica TaxID=1088818 RepID=A0A2I0BEX3_9ASPA|nr:Bax inhibitor 1 [Apostasia shenzhenica]
MEAFFSGQYSARGWSYESLKNFRQISPAVQNHLKLVCAFIPVDFPVYLTLCSALVSAAAGVYLHILFNVGGTLTMLGCFLGISVISMTPPYAEKKRFGLLMGTALLQGASIGPLFEVILNLDSRIILNGLVGTSLAFACFSGAAIVAKRREFLYLGGFLSAFLSVLLWMQFASTIFGQNATMFNVELYLGLLVFLGYIVFDTQVIIEKAHRGDLDYVKHALTLFTDFVAIAVRILIIMGGVAALPSLARGGES